MTAEDGSNPALWSRAFAILRDLEDLEGEALADAARAHCTGDPALESSVLLLLNEHEDDHAGILGEVDAELGLGPMTHGGQMPQIDGIELTHLLGQGGSGDVYAGRQLNPEREVAVKVLRSGLSSRRAVSRFAREAKALAAISHESVAAIHAVAEARLPNNALAPCLIMEHVRGPTLREVTKPMPLGEAATLAARIARGLHAAHQRGVVHRDLKPSNVIIDHEGRPRIIDFGIAALQAGGASVTMQTMTGELLGTLGYMSPEQIDGTSEVADVRIDVYAIGVLFYELLSGEPAVDMRSGSSVVSIQTIVKGTLPRLPTGGDAEAVYRKATALEASRRYDSAAALADDLERLAAGRPVSARPPSFRYTASMFAKRHPWPIALGAVALSAVIGLSAAAAVGFLTASRERDAAVLAEARASAASAFLRGMLASPDPDVDGPSVKVVDLLDRSAGQISAMHADDPLVAMDLHRTIGWTYASLSEHDNAVVHLGQAVDLARENLDDTDSELLDLESMLVDSYVYVGRLNDALTLSESVVERCGFTDQTPPATHAAALVSYAEVLRNLGRPDQATEALHRAREISFASPDTTDEQYRAALSGLGRNYLDQTLAADARAVFERLLSMFEPSEIGSASDWFVARGNLAIALSSEGRHADAIPVYEEVLARGVPALGELHYTMRMVRSILPDSYLAEGRVDEALAMSERSLRDAEQIYGRGHADELLAVSNHAVLLLQLGRPEEAIPYTSRLAAEMPRVLGPSHPRTLIGLRNHAATLDNVGRDDEAAAVLYDVLRIQHETLGDAHFDTMVTKNNLAFLLESIGRSSEAVELMKSVVDHAGPESGLPEPARAVFLLNLGRSLISTGDFEAADAALMRSLELAPESASHSAKVRDARERLKGLREAAESTPNTDHQQEQPPAR